MFRERLSHYGMKTIVAPGQVMLFTTVCASQETKRLYHVTT